MRVRHIVIAMVVSAAVIAPGPAGAHGPGTYFPPTFVGDSSWPFGSMNMWFTTTFPNSQTWRDRIQEAHANWPQSTGRPPVYFGMAGTNWSFQNCQPDNVNGVHYWPLNDPTRAANTYSCTSFGYWSTQIVINSQRDWNVSNSAPGANQVDLESVATHEFGHAYGWHGPHWDQAPGSPSCGDVLTRETMCSATFVGQLRTRTPEIHDVHTMDAAF